MHEIVLIQSVIEHLGMALRLLDKLDADIPATHVDAALQALREDPAVRSPIQLAIDDGARFRHVDAMIDELFGKFVLREPNLLPER